MRWQTQPIRWSGGLVNFAASIGDQFPIHAGPTGVMDHAVEAITDCRVAIVGAEPFQEALLNEPRTARAIPARTSPRFIEDTPAEEEPAMPAYSVKFCNVLDDSTGHEVHACQRAITIRSAPDEEAAIEAAKREFERLEEIGHWEQRARSIECERIPPPRS